MFIEQIESDKKRFLPLLLLADEQESMIDRYIERGSMFVMRKSADAVVCVAVVTDEGNNICELKNIAVSPEYQSNGYGRMMIDFLCDRYGSRFHTMTVGTGNSSKTVSFYRSCGFAYSHTVPGFFMDNYDHPIIEDGKVLEDMIYFRKSIFRTVDIPRNERTESLVTDLVALWEKSVRASHHFLEEKDINGFIPLVGEFIYGIENLLVAYQCGAPKAFIGIENNKIEMLFVSPECFRCGLGKELTEWAICKYGAVYVDVNEQNPNAAAFYRRMGFAVFERCETDGQGNPYPILKMKLKNDTVMDEMELMMHLHLGNERQGPGSDDITSRALDLAGIDRSKAYKIADIGCGTGAQTISLARRLKGEIVAVDLFDGFLDKLKENTRKESLAAEIRTMTASMDKLPFGRGEFDIIWSEGAVYNMGFAKGVLYWKDFLKTGGILAVSELSWITGNRPSELEDFWNGEYSEMDTVSGKIRILEEAGYQVMAHFILPENCWTDNYYSPLLKSHKAFLEEYGVSDVARKIVDTDIKEAEFYRKYKDYYSYGFYIARKI